jgi:hypothetical protein
VDVGGGVGVVVLVAAGLCLLGRLSAGTGPDQDAGFRAGHSAEVVQR